MQEFAQGIKYMTLNFFESKNKNSIDYIIEFTRFVYFPLLILRVRLEIIV